MTTLFHPPDNTPAAQKAIWYRCLAGRGASIKFDKAASLIHQRFEQVVNHCSDRIALKTPTYSLTYDELNRDANRLAHTICRHCSDEQETVALLMPLGIPLIVGMLGIWKAGKTWVRIDPSNSKDRINYLLRDSNTSLVVISDSHDAFAWDWRQGGIPKVNVEALDKAISDKNPDKLVPPNSPAYIRYTSGSTGIPKGCATTHSTYMRGINDTFIGAHDRVITLEPDLSGLFQGACTYPVTVAQEGLAHVADMMLSDEITVYVSVTTAFRYFMDTLQENEAFPKLRLIMLNGELVYRRDVERYKRHSSRDCIFVNVFASTEAGGIARYLIDHDTQIAGNVVPVGHPVEGKNVFVLDETGSEITDGRVGEIAVSSEYLSPGYWGQPELTRSVFLRDQRDRRKNLYITGDLGYWLPDGSLVVVDRKDFQITLHGERIEYAEIEMALLDCEGVKEAVVVSRRNAKADTCLVAYIIFASPLHSVSALRKELAEKLSESRLPVAYVVVEALPLTSTGKIDRRSLSASEGLDAQE